VVVSWLVRARVATRGAWRQRRTNQPLPSTGGAARDVDTQHVDEETTQEVDGGQRHDALTIAQLAVPPGEGDLAIVEGQDAIVGDGDAMLVAAEVAHEVLGPAEVRRGVDHRVVTREASTDELAVTRGRRSRPSGSLPCQATASSAPSPTCIDAAYSMCSTRRRSEDTALDEQCTRSGRMASTPPLGTMHATSGERCASAMTCWSARTPRQ